MKHSHESERTSTDEVQDSRAAVNPPHGVNASRRRFTRAGLSGSVIMTLASRPAAASFCSHSGTMSGNLSRPGGGTCYGLTPGYWKTHPESWSCGYEPGMCNPVRNSNGECKDYEFVTYGFLKNSYKSGLVTQAVYSAYMAWANWTKGVTPASALPAPSIPPTTLGQAFAGSGLSFANPNQTMMQAFWDPPEDINPQTLVAHASAALLNVCRFGEAGYGYTQAGLIQFIRDWTGGLEALKNALQSLNERGGS